MKLFKLFLVVIFMVNFLIPPGAVFAQSAASDVLVDLGMALYRRGEYQGALQEFNKALILDPENQKAIKQIQTIASKNDDKQQNVLQALDKFENKSSNDELKVAKATKVAKPAKVTKKTKATKLAKATKVTAVKETKEIKETTDEVIPIAPQVAPKLQSYTKNEVTENSPVSESNSEVKPESRGSKEDEVNNELDKLSSKDKPVEEEAKKEEPEKKKGPYLQVTGDVQLALGVDETGDVEWKDANADLNERNYRILSGDLKYNTHDPAIFSRLNLNMDTKNLDQIGLDHFSAHLNLTIDPWSFTGKSEKFNVTGAWGTDNADFELLYWSNTRRVINQTYYTNLIGDAVGFPELKVVNGYTPSITRTSVLGDAFTLPATKVNMNFMPVRELWFDYKDDTHKFRFFPIAYQDQALTTDDPLTLSNKTSWWEESPWLADWRPGNLNTGATPDNFTQGRWDDDLAFFTRDSDNLRLTALRGFAFGYEEDGSSLKSTYASPKNLWADYGDFHTNELATRYKHDFLPNFGMGLTHTGHYGFNVGTIDAYNNVLAADFKNEPTPGTKFVAEVAASQSVYDASSEGYASRSKGNAYYFALENRFPGEEIYNQDFNSIRQQALEEGYLKSKIRVARMDKGFDPSLASFNNTAADSFWSRHITFRKHPTYFYTGDTSPMNFDDIKAFAIGDGLESGNDVIGWRLEGGTKFFGRQLDSLFDVRNVHETGGGFKENVSRVELVHSTTDKLTTKFLGVRTQMPKTELGVDPYFMDEFTNEGELNTAIDGGDDPSLSTLSAGADYKLTEKVSLNAVYEYTNDTILATGGYPQGLFNGVFYSTYEQYGRLYSREVPFLFNQRYFDIPPYNYFNIFKFGLDYKATDKLGFYFDYTRNENKNAGQIDEQMNHYGVETTYQPIEKLSFVFKYTLANWVDLNYLNDTGNEIYRWHNNFFLSSKYLITKDSEFIFDYGVGGVSPIGSVNYDPFGGALPVLDTQHLVRLYYKKKF